MPLPRQKSSPKKAASKKTPAKGAPTRKRTAAKKVGPATRPAKTAVTKKAKAATSPSRAKKSATSPKRSAMAARRVTSAVAQARTVKQYEHPTKKRLNNPPVGLVTPETDPDLAPKTYAYDPHLDPQLVWTGKEEKSKLTIDTVSLHVHERIDPYTIIEAVRTQDSFVEQPSLFSRPAENPPLREAVDFYKHQHGWANRLVAGDSALVMNSLLEREGMGGQVQMVYLDPPYGIRYGSNFQPFVNRKDVRDGSDDDLTREPEMIRAFRDTWELGTHSYLSYLRDRLKLARELLADKGSIFVQISNENVHLIRNLCDEVFGAANFISQISFNKNSGLGGNYLPSVNDYIVWYAKSKENAKFRKLLRVKAVGVDGLGERYTSVLLPDGSVRPMTAEERSADSSLPAGAKAFRISDPTAQGFRPNTTISYEFRGKVYHPGDNRCWRTTREGLDRLARSKRLIVAGNKLGYVRLMDDFPAFPMNNVWTEIGGIASRTDGKVYVVQTSTTAVARCMLMTTDPGDIVLDPTCGAGTTAYVAEQWGRRWITCDTSRVAISIAKQRLITSSFDYYDLSSEDEGVDGGLRYKTIPHVTLKSIANNEPPELEVLYDQPVVNRGKARVTGPFTVEAVPAPMVAAMHKEQALTNASDATVARSGVTQRESDWREALLKAGVRALNKSFIAFSRLEPLTGTKFLHAAGETKEDPPRRVVVSFGSDYAPLEQRQVEAAWGEARTLAPRPDILLFAAFQFDSEAAKDIDEMPEAVTRHTSFLKVQMDTDLLTRDLKKKGAGNQSFWLVGRPDVEVRAVAGDDAKGKLIVEVHGFDYYDVKSGEIESGNSARISMWLLDTDYDGRSLFPRQVFFPMAGNADGWGKLLKTLRAELDADLIEAYRGTVSLPFTPGKRRKIAVKIVDDRGIESLRVMDTP